MHAVDGTDDARSHAVTAEADIRDPVDVAALVSLLKTVEDITDIRVRLGPPDGFFHDGTSLVFHVAQARGSETHA
jgi:hypothetical protein